MNNYYGHSRPEIQELVPKTAKKILDVGCAWGKLGKALKERQDCCYRHRVCPGGGGSGQE